MKYLDTSVTGPGYRRHTIEHAIRGSSMDLDGLKLQLEATNSEDELIDQLVFGLANDLIKFGAAQEVDFTD